LTFGDHTGVLAGEFIFSTLARYITIPESLIPRTTMNFGGLQHSQERADLHAFLPAQTL
jgi:cytochrome c2